MFANPPLERWSVTPVGFSATDMDPNGVYGSYFKDFSFKFNSSQRANAYDVALDPDNGPAAAANGQTYYQAFTIDTASLSRASQMRFEVSNTALKTNDEINFIKWAYFNKSGRSAQAVPEPGSMILLGTGVVALVARFRRRRGSDPSL
jgi:hypothetical protein